MKLEKDFVAHLSDRVYDLLRQRASVEHDDLEYLVERASRLKDQRMQEIIAELIGWSDDDRAELETVFAIAIEVLRKTSVSRLREATRIVELRYYARKRNGEETC